LTFELSEEQALVRDLVARFVRDELMPLEREILQRETSGQDPSLLPAELAKLDQKSRAQGLWALDAPEDLGGSNLPMSTMVVVFEQMGRTITPYTLPPDSPNLRMLRATVSDAQRRRYLEPYARGEAQSAIAISEPGAGSDPSRMITRAVRYGDSWVLNGRKIWVSRAANADFTIVMAVTDRDKGTRGGISAFLVDRGTKGFEVLRRIPMIGGNITYEIALEDCRLHAESLLGREGGGFAPMQLRLSTRRLQMAAWCVGIAERALEIMCEHARQRVTFGVPLSERQAVQWWIADAATRIHACRLMTQDAAEKVDRGLEPRTEISMVKVYGTEMAWDVIDHAMQALGAMGMVKEMPLQFLANKVRVMRIYEGPSEVHRWVVARNVLAARG
jgi:acyl-CoA dehydrogenase